jgi:benzoyl-CoA reductase/2-hydroxyglutaryl-CoA dehydratase subunit BcrC/BadD/HgdB
VSYLKGLRKLAAKIDELTWKDNKVTGWENHISLVSFSDLKSNPLMFERELKDFIATAGNRKQMTHTLRIAYVGVPPVLSDIYDFVELCDARVVYNEVQKEFAFIDADEHATVYDQYLNYSYPFDMPFRITKINYELKKRKVDGIIHYTQAFCHRAIDHIMLRDAFKVPVINIEGDKENILDARSKLRLEAFLDMLKDKKQFGE